MKKTSLLFIPIVIAVYISAAACSKKVEHIDSHKPFPIEELPVGIYERATAYGKKNGYKTEFIQTPTAGKYNLRYLIDSTGVKMPPPAVMYARQQEMNKKCYEVYKEVFFDRFLDEFKCILVVFDFDYYDNGFNYVFSN